MSNKPIPCPITKEQTVEKYFLEHRAQVIDIAAFLDRIDRAQAPGPGHDDFRIKALIKSIQLLIDGKPDRTKRILQTFSDPTDQLIEKAGTKGATGAYPQENAENKQ